MSFDSGFRDEFQSAARVHPFGYAQPDPYYPGFHEEGPETRYSRREYAGASQGDYPMGGGSEADVVEGAYDDFEDERFDRDEPLYYRRAAMTDGIPDRGIGRMLSETSSPSIGAMCPSDSMSETCKEACAKDSEKSTTTKKAFDSFLDETHASMSAKYAESKITEDVRKLSQVPVVLSASCMDEEIPKSAGVIIVNEKKFSRIQESKLGRDEACQKKLQSSAINFVRGLTGMDFSMITNPSVEKKISSLVLNNPETGKPVAKLSPYVMWDTSTSVNSPELLVDKAEGFPSISEKERDNVLEAGYMVTVLDKEGVRINGVYGGKKGKIMQPGQSLYYGDVLVFPARAKRMPVWIRVASNKPSELAGKEGNVSVSHMDAKMVPLRVGRPASQMSGFSGKAVRRLKVTEVSGSSSAASKKGEDSHVINASLQIDFKS